MTNVSVRPIYTCAHFVELLLGSPTFKICTASIMGARTADGKFGTCTVNFLESAVFLQVHELRISSTELK
jgi:hypothetical protein